MSVFEVSLMHCPEAGSELNNTVNLLFGLSAQKKIRIALLKVYKTNIETNDPVVVKFLQNLPAAEVRK